MTDDLPIVSPADAERRAAQAFWRHLLPMSVALWTDEDFEDHLLKVEKALQAHPDLDIGRKGRQARITTTHLRQLRPGSEARQLAILGQLAQRGWQFDAQDIVGLADQVHTPADPDARVLQAVFKQFVNDLAQAGQSPDLKHLVQCIDGPDSKFSPTLLAFLAAVGLDVIGAGGAGEELMSNGDNKRLGWALAVAQGALDPLDHDLTRHFNRHNKPVTEIWQARIMQDARMVEALARFNQLKKEKPLFTAADLTRPVTEGAKSLCLIDMLALSGRAAEALEAARWQGNAKELAEVIAQFEARLDCLPMDKVALLATVKRTGMQRADKPKVRFKP